MKTCLVVGTDESPRADVSAKMRALGFDTKEARCVAEALVPLREPLDALVLLDWPMKRQGPEVVSILGRPLGAYTLVIESGRPVGFSSGAKMVRQANDIELESLKDVFAHLVEVPEPKAPAKEKSEAA